MKPVRLYNPSTFRMALGASRLVPRAAAQGMASLVGELSFRLCGDRREVMKKNLAEVTGLRGRALERLAARNFRNFIRSLADYCYCATRDVDGIRGLFDDFQGLEHLEAAKARGRGTVLITAHLGNWELGGIQLGSNGVPLTVVTLEEQTAELTEWRLDYRRRMGVETIVIGSDKFAFVELVSKLKKNEVVAMLVDRPYGRSSTPVPFFGKQALFSTGPAALWQHTGASIVPVHVLQTPSGRYSPVALRPMEIAESGDPKQDGGCITRQIAEIFEKVIRLHPDQWYNYVPIWRHDED